MKEGTFRAALDWFNIVKESGIFGNDFDDRLCFEMIELGDRIVGLSKKLNDENWNIPAQSRRLLKRQLSYMKKYFRILEIRYRRMNGWDR